MILVTRPVFFISFFVITKELTTELQDILRDDFDVECSRDEANAIARELIGFFEFLTEEEHK